MDCHSFDIVRLQIYQIWQKHQAEGAVAARKPDGEKGTTAASTNVKVPGVTDAFYAKLTVALEVGSFNH